MRKGTKLYGNYLDEYKVIEHIANGGNSEVYKIQNSDGEIFALKLLGKNLSKEKIKRFKNEMNFCIKTNHENIIKIIDNGITEDKTQLFYIMPLYCKTLRDFINEEHTPDEIIKMFMSILNGVKFFHNRGVIHRDLKPENVLLNDEDVPIITDFGIAHFSEDDLLTKIETQLGSKLANFQYAAPEQRDKHSKITHKADIYALGLIFNEMFTKKVIFGSSYKKIADINDKYKFLDNIIDKMTKQNPNDRFDSIEDIEFNIVSAIKVYEKEEEIKKLKEIKIEESEEKDILILEPPKLINFKYDDTLNILFLYLDKKVNQEWIECMTKGSYGSLLGYGPERFRFQNEIAMVNIPPSYLNDLQTIINYFKSWVNNANQHYPIEVKKRRAYEKQKKENEIKQKIEREETIKKALESVHI